jgi:two-component system, NarL family, sensor histidine kinase BarA
VGARRLEEPARLEELLEPDEVRELIAAQAALTGCGLRVVTASGLEMARAGADGDQALAVRPVDLAGQLVGRLEVMGPDPARASEVADAMVALLRVALRIGLERFRISRMHQDALAEAKDEITEKTARLHGAVERLNELDRVKSNFLATISHELRTPLTSVIGYSEMLLEGMAGAISAEQREYLETILSKADNLLQIITGILEVARMESGVLRVERNPVVITDLIHGVAATLSSEAARRSINLSLPGVAMPRVLGDSRKLRQVVTHLLTNALKFTPQGGGVAVETAIGPLSPTRGPGRARDLGVLVSVRDTGIGIPSGALAHIFEPFYQVDQSSTRAYGGTGLGLSLTKSYVEAHGGSIWVDSRPGEGSTFTVSLPAVPEELAEHVGGVDRAS